MASNASNQGDDDTEILQFNLTNPEQLTEQLKSADLDDQETDVLLQEAMRINAQLKEALKIQQLEELEKPRSGKAGKPKAQHPLAEPMAPRNPKQSSLPPIVTKNDKHRSSPGRHVQKDTKSKSLTSTPKRKSSATKSKPAWDDRFNYT